MQTLKQIIEEDGGTVYIPFDNGNAYYEFTYDELLAFIEEQNCLFIELGKGKYYCVEMKWKVYG